MKKIFDVHMMNFDGALKAGVSLMFGKYRLSFIWGMGTYSQNRDGISEASKSHQHIWRVGSDTVEVAVINEETDKWATRQVWWEVFGACNKPDDDVVGHVTLADLAKVIHYLADEIDNEAT